MSNNTFYDALVGMLHDIVPKELGQVYGQYMGIVSQVFYNNTVKLEDGSMARVLNYGRPEIGKEYLIIRTLGGKKFLWMPFIYGSSINPAEVLSYLPIDVYSPNGYMSYSFVEDEHLWIYRLFPPPSGAELPSGTSSLAVRISGLGLVEDGAHIIDTQIVGGAYSATMLGTPSISGTGSAKRLTYKRYDAITEAISAYGGRGEYIALPTGYTVGNSVGASVTMYEPSATNCTSSAAELIIPPPVTVEEILSDGILFAAIPSGTSGASGAAYLQYALYGDTLLFEGQRLTGMSGTRITDSFMVDTYVGTELIEKHLFTTIVNPGGSGLTLYKDYSPVASLPNLIPSAANVWTVDYDEISGTMTALMRDPAGTYPSGLMPSGAFTKVGQESFESSYYSPPAASLTLFQSAPSAALFNDQVVGMDGIRFNLKRDLTRHYPVERIAIPAHNATFYSYGTRVYTQPTEPVPHVWYSPHVFTIDADVVVGNGFNISGTFVVTPPTLLPSGSTYSITDGKRSTATLISVGDSRYGPISGAVVIKEYLDPGDVFPRLNAISAEEHAWLATYPAYSTTNINYLTTTDVIFSTASRPAKGTKFKWGRALGSDYPSPPYNYFVYYQLFTVEGDIAEETRVGLGGYSPETTEYFAYTNIYDPAYAVYQAAVNAALAENAAFAALYPGTPENLPPSPGNPPSYIFSTASRPPTGSTFIWHVFYYYGHYIFTYRLTVVGTAGAPYWSISEFTRAALYGKYVE